MKRRILSLLLVLTLLLALPFAGSAEAAAKLKVTATMTSNDSLFFGENLELKVEDENGHPVTDGNVTFGHNGKLYDRPVSNGVAQISADDLVNRLGLVVGEQAEVTFSYQGSESYEPSEVPGKAEVTVNSKTVTQVAMTYSGYAYGNDIATVSIQTSAGANIAGVRFYDAKDQAQTAGSFGEGAYKVWINLAPAFGYEFPEKGALAVTLNGEKPLDCIDGFYVFQLDRLVTTYHIKYTLVGGTMSGAPETYTENSADITLPQPTKADYRFTGWTGTDLTAPTMEVTIPTGSKGDREYTANWEKIQYFTVFYNVHDHGTAPAEEKVESGKTAAKPEDPTADGWKFKGWYISDDYIGEPFDFTTAITRDTTLHAKWARTWTVTFDVGDHGTAPAAQTVEDGAKATKPADPTAEDYSFQGWYTDTRYTMEYDFSKEVTEDTTVYAKWVKKPIVSFNTNGHGTAPTRQTVELNGKATKPADPTAEGYVFRGWYTTAACTTEFDFNTPIAADTTLYAKWDEIYTVTFNVGGHGTAPTPQKVENGSKATKPENPTAKGWRFDGWYTDEKCTARYDFDKAVTANTTLYAKWTQLFTLTFETNGGTKIDSVEAPDGSLVYLGSYKPTKSGYYFVGWYTDKNLTRASRVGYVRMDGNKTVYAKFAVADKTNPKTADPALPGLALAVLSFSTVGLAALGIQKRK